VTDPHDPYAAPRGEHPQQEPTQPFAVPPPASSASTPFDAPRPPDGYAAPGAGQPTTHPYVAPAPPGMPQPYEVPGAYRGASAYQAGGYPPGPYQAGGPQGGGYPGAAAPYPYAPRRTNGLAVASLVVGILWLYWVGSVLALIFGYVALAQIRKAPATAPQEGRALAIAGVVLGWVGVSTLLLVVALGAFLFSAPGPQYY